MRRILSSALALLVTSALYSQQLNTANNGQPINKQGNGQHPGQITQPTLSKVNGSTVIPVSLNKLKPITTAPNMPKPSGPSNLTRPINQYKAAAQNVNNTTVNAQNVNSSNPRNLPLSKNGKLLSPDGYEITFPAPGTDPICSTPMPIMLDANKNPACGLNVPEDDAAVRDGADTATIKYFQLIWHVFTDGGPSTNIDSVRIYDLMQELNADYSTHNMVFCREATFFIESSTWYTHNSAVDEFPMKQAFNIRPTEVINIYVVGSMASGGYARMPYDPNGGTDQHGGIVLNRGNCSVGTHTLAHEMGHTMGLFHTFNGVSERATCSNCFEQVRNANGSSNTTGVPTPLGGPYTQEGDREGDWCSDTHPHAQDSYQCPGPAAQAACDAFARVPGNYPVDNHMSYSFCSSIFTSQQERRMHVMVDRYLASWTAYGGGLCGSLPPTADFVGTPQNWQSPNTVTFTDLSQPTSIISTWTWDFNSAGQAGTVTPATFVGQNPPPVVYDIGASPTCLDYEVTLTITGPNGGDTEIKTSYINVCPPSGECDTMDLYWTNPTPSPSIYSWAGPGGYCTGVPDASTMLPTTLTKFMFERYITPTVGTSKIGGVRVGVGNLVDADADMRFDVVIYDDDGTGQPGAFVGGVGNIDPTAIGVPGPGFFAEYWVPFFTPAVPTTALFHAAVIITQGDNTDELVVVASQSAPTFQGQGNALNHFFTADFGLANYLGVGGLDFDLDIVPLLGEYRPLPLIPSFTENPVCDTTYATLFDTVLYTNYAASDIVGMTYSFTYDGTTISTTAPLGSIPRVYTSPGPDTVTVTAINNCGRADTTVWIIPYTFNATPDANFTKDLPNPICENDIITFTADSTGYQDYTWDFGDGNIVSSGATNNITHSYTTAGLYTVTLTTTTAAGCTASITLSDFVEIVNCTINPPQADLNATDSTGCAPLTITFTDNTTLGDPATSWLWNFGDGNFSTLQNPPPHLYATPGTYFVSFQACNPGGCTTDFLTVTVGTAVTSNAGPDQNICGTTSSVFAGNDPTPDSGMWALIAGSGVPTTPTSFNSAVTGLGVGTNSFTWTITGTGCTSVDTVDIIVTTAPDAGTDNTLSACSNDGTTDLITLLGGADAGGTWIGPSALANGDQGTFDPGTNLAGTYQYIVTGTAPCTNDTSDVVVTITPAPNAGTDNTLSACSNDGTTDLITLLGGADAGGTWIGPSALANGDQGTFDPGTNLAGTYQYVVTGAGSCSNDTADVVVTITPAPNAGTDNTLSACSNDGTTDLITLLGGADAGGTWIGPSALANGDQGTFDPGTNLAGTYQYVITGAAPCSNDTSDVVVTITPAPNAGTDNTLTVCSTDGTTDLITLLGGADAGGTWIGPSALANGDQGTFDPGTNLAGTYQYVVTGAGPCGNDTADVVVTINPAPNAGTDNTLSSCSNDGTTDLITLLGVADAGGTWIGPSALANGDQGTFDPGTNLAGTYQYVVTGTAPCSNDTSDVVVTITPAPNAGTDNTLSACSNDGTTDLISLLGGADAGGTWIGPSALANGDQGTFDPGTNLAGTYQYVVTGAGPCGNDTADVVVTITPAPNAGTDNTLTACSSDGTTDLITLLGGADAGGTWIGPSALANGDQGTFDPGTNLAGTYQYVVTGAGPCGNDTADVVVTIVPAANAGTDNTFSICTSAPPTDLFNLLGAADAGGTWIGPSALANGDQGTFDPGTNLAGTYQYIVTGTAPCSNDTADVVVTITANDDPTFVYADICEGSGGLPGVINTPGGTFSFNPNPGDGATINPTTGAIANEVGGSTYNIQYLTPAGPCQDSVTISINIITPANAGTDNTFSACSNDGTTDLITLLGGADAGGSWIGPSALANGDQGTFDPGTNLAGTYQYVVTGTAPCSNDTSDVVVTITPAPNAGTDNTLSACSNDGTTDLITLLGGADAGGTWIGPSALANGDQGTFDPGTNLAGTYQYVVTGAGPCGNDTSDVVVTITPAPNAGTDNTLSACSNDGTTDLITLLGGADAGGTWIGPSALANGDQGTFDPGTNLAGTYQYVVTGAGPCGNDTSDVVVTITPAPNAGTDNTLSACSNDGTTDLITLLGGADAGGTWIGPSALANGDQGTFDPGTNLAGTYQYVVTGAGPCGNDTADVVITITPAANAGTDNNFGICASAAPTDLFNLLGGADAGGTWIGPSALANGDQGTFDPGTNLAGTYQYIVTGTAPCSNDTADVVVTITANDDPTFVYADICAGSGGLPGVINTPGGTFSFNPDPGDGATINPTTGAIANEVAGSTYNIQYLTPAGPCQDSVTLSINIVAPANAGGDSSLTACASASPTDLFNLLGGADAGGTWIGPSALANGDQGTFDPGTNLAGTYQYIVTGTAPCSNDTADVVVTITANDDPTFVYADICAGSGGLPGTINTPGGTFSFNPDPGDGATINPTTGAIANEVAGSTYNIQYLTPAGPCQDSVTLSINIVAPANAGGDSSLTVCAAAAPSDLFNLLGGADAGGTWIGPSALANGDQGTFDPGTNVAGTYQYIVTGTAPCGNDTADVVVTITTNDDPTFTFPDICAGSGGLPGTINTPGGTFSFNPNPGDGATINPTTGAIANEVAGSTYNIQYLTPAGPCQDSVTISVNIIAPANAGTDNTLTVCSSDGTTNLISLLGAADVGGTWSGPSALAGGDQGTFDPGTNAAGTYLYIVAGTAPCGPDTAQVTVTVNAAPNAGTPGSVTLCDTDPTIDLYTLLTGADPGGSWSPALTSGTGVFDPALDAGGIYTYTVTGTAPCGNANSTVTVTIDNSGCTVTPPPATTIIISNMLTPNGDGKNDTWYIENVHLLDGSPVAIYNRWGTKLFETTSYQNDWDGTYNGEALPDGSYFYVVEFNGETLQGPLTLLRTTN